MPTDTNHPKAVNGKSTPKTQHHPTMKLTIKNNYHGETRTINSTCPRYIKQVRESMRRGDGDFVKIIDEKGQMYDVTDFGRGLELVNIATGSVVL
jgi:hypothetical protein